MPFDKSVTAEKRTDTMLGWLDLPSDQRPAFITLHFDQVDSAGHAGGPDSDQVNKALALVDGAIGHPVDGLKQRGLFDRVTLIVELTQACGLS